MGRARGNLATAASPSRGGVHSFADLEAEVIAADESAPRQNCETTCARRHPDWNEDRVLCDPANGVAAVFDGMGGHFGGEFASRAACGALAMDLDRLPAREDLEGRRSWLEAALRNSQGAIALSKRANPEASGQGTTAVTAVLAGDKVLTANVGDSRVYRLRGGELSILSDEHDRSMPRPEIADRLDRVATRDEIDDDPVLRRVMAHRHVLSTELGQPNVRVEAREHDAQPGDLVIVCSDGVHDNLTHDEMQSIAAERASEGSQAVAHWLVRKAGERSRDSEHIRSKDDDVTCAVLAA